MGLKSTINSAISSAFAAVGDLKDSITYRRITLGNYEVDVMEQSLTPTDEVIQVVITDYKSAEVDGDRIMSYDRKVLINADDVSYRPNVRDKIYHDGQWHNIISPIRSIPGSGIYLLQIRATE